MLVAETFSKILDSEKELKFDYEALSDDEQDELEQELQPTPKDEMHIEGTETQLNPEISNKPEKKSKKKKKKKKVKPFYYRHFIVQ